MSSYAPPRYSQDVPKPRVSSTAFPTHSEVMKPPVPARLLPPKPVAVVTPPVESPVVLIAPAPVVVPEPMFVQEAPIQTKVATPPVHTHVLPAANAETASLISEFSELAAIASLCRDVGISIVAFRSNLRSGFDFRLCEEC